ncbi:MAG: Hpt domain-containing protein, partial [Clostridia bacterium]|nr:Hpt domain-containing protein [Clostridia bacterium]
IMEYAEKCPVRQDVLDPAAGLRNLGGDAALYQQVLAEYVRENRGFADRLSEAIDSGQFDEAARMVHKMKSSSGSIGAKPVYEQSVELQKLLREGNKAAIKPAQTRFSILTEQLLAEITDYQKQAERLPE